jgi:hypothetical protein
MHWPFDFAPLMAFGGRFDVTGLYHCNALVCFMRILNLESWLCNKGGGGALTILISRNQTSDVKSPAKCHEWGKIEWPPLLHNQDSRFKILINQTNALQWYRDKYKHSISIFARSWQEDGCNTIKTQQRRRERWLTRRRCFWKNNFEKFTKVS